MNKYYLLLPVLFATVFLGILAFYGMLPHFVESVSSMVQPAIDMIQPALTQAQTMWATIPGPIRGYILPGILGAFGLFMTWTKLRVMEGAKQAKVQATTAFNQVSGEASEYKQQLEQVTGERDSFKTQLGQQSNLGFEGMRKEIEDAQKMVTVKAGEVNDLHAVVRKLTEDNKKLVLENDLLKPKPIP